MSSVVGSGMSRCGGTGGGVAALLPGGDCGQRVVVWVWLADGTAGVVERGTHWDGVLASAEQPRRRRMYIGATRGSTLVRAAERP